MLGTWKDQTDSLDTILLLLYHLKLLDRFVKQVQQYVKKNINEIVENTSIKRNELYQFLAIECVKNKSDVKHMAEFIHRIKSEFTQLPNFVLEKQHNENQYASTRELADFPVNPISSSANQDVVTEINIAIQKLYKFGPFRHRVQLFGGTKHMAEITRLQAEIENIRATSTSTEELHARLKTALCPFINNNPTFAAKLRSELSNINHELLELNNPGKSPARNNVIKNHSSPD